MKHFHSFPTLNLPGFSTVFLYVVFILILFSTASFSQKLGRHTVEEWHTIIDTTWKAGPSTDSKLAIFDYVYDEIDQNFASFQSLPENILDSLTLIYRPQIEAGVSYGRFVAIMNHFAMAFKEFHLWVINDDVNVNTPLKTGIPLFFLGSWPDNSHFGATLTPLPDSTLLVIRTLPNHPLDLIPGDIILGYDNVPWKILYKELLTAQFPYFAGFPNGSTEKAFTHDMLKTAGMNWHLFDTLDVVKFDGGDTLHYPTALLAGQNGNIAGNEQLDIPGVPFPDIDWQGVFGLDTYNLKNYVSWGIVNGTNIGYIYVYGWFSNTKAPGSNISEEFYNALDSLMNYYKIEGLIFDDRFCFGGGQFDTEDKGFSLLFNSYIETIAFDERCNPNNHLQMCAHPSWNAAKLAITGDPGTFFDRPIAVLTGPGSESQGEIVALKMTFHPMVRLFGKSTNGAFSGVGNPNRQPGSGWHMYNVDANAYLVSNPGHYLSRTESHVDEEVWLTQEDVAKGEDTVVKRAIEWIQNLSHAHDVTVDKTYIKPSSGNVQISAQVENPNYHDLSVLAYISLDDTTVVDSTYLTQKDSIWSAPWSVGEEENIYHISVKTDDADAGTSRTIPNVTHFTSAGPVIIDTIYTSGNDTIPNPGDSYIRFELFLENNGLTDTIKNVTVKPVFLNPCTKQAGFFLPKFYDIAPGEKSKGDRPLGINFADSCQGGPVDFALEIMSDGFVFWTDTFQVDVVVGFENIETDLPTTIKLAQNYPNPFNPTTTISYQLPAGANHYSPLHVELSIYNLLGQKVVTIVDKKQTAGRYQVQLDASDFTSGIYYYKLSAGDFQQVKKMVLLK